MSKVFKALLILIIFTNTAFGQDNKLGSWGIFNIQMPGDSSHKWGGMIELQSRSNELFNQFNYYETKGGVSYDLDKNFTALLGGGRYLTYDYNNLGAGPTIIEARMWQQMTLSQYLDRIKLEHRYRIEQRWLNGHYRNRFRYRINAFVPLNKKKVGPETFFITVFNEIFLNNHEPHFERNRFSAGLGYQFDKKWILQAAWLNQYNYVPGKGSAKNNIAFTLMYRILRKNAVAGERIPSTSD
ncbi:DUF2490 domain-containing protein [Mucilaginibacter myungsuensis]|uniref:DUF2490 domain-containing protein n=1 Tax=Mucilaginibacter myungsuensis TaxID=649104 RepID=A0A929PWZ7_9SPHI|nr:DUF2490 domain-containing protein [Mucilaginibacter myungsuensis]MBE9661702.1 DUF2490 domain-containing protein [Mucilaginibacter myungsuensis]MDN3597845.1 DUF2490 domain-containing protein [Mucilaginibacter myungsuensis]